MSSMIRQAHHTITTMLLLGTLDSSETFADSDAVTTVACSAVISIDDAWLEAVLDNLALAHLPRAELGQLLARLEALEQAHDARPSGPSDRRPQYKIIVGDHFDDVFNAHGMRAPDTMTPDNVLDAIETAGRHFSVEGHRAALQQLVFFISGNL
jgi:hypothetical protein